MVTRHGCSHCRNGLAVQGRLCPARLLKEQEWAVRPVTRRRAVRRARPQSGARRRDSGAARRRAERAPREGARPAPVRGDARLRRRCRACVTRNGARWKRSSPGTAAAKTTATAGASCWLDTRLGVRVNDRVGVRGRPVPGSWARGSLLCFFSLKITLMMIRLPFLESSDSDGGSNLIY